jgi:hypothetical protein
VLATSAIPAESAGVDSAAVKAAIVKVRCFLLFSPAFTAMLSCWVHASFVFLCTTTQCIEDEEARREDGTSIGPTFVRLAW